MYRDRDADRLCIECGRLLTPEITEPGDICTSCAYADESKRTVTDPQDRVVTHCAVCSRPMYENDKIVGRMLGSSITNQIIAVCSPECHALYIQEFDNSWELED